jgi:NADPH-dependent curcumin reductase CurA
MGCRVIGIAGGAAKCAEVVARFGFDACLDYRAPDLAGRLRAAAPQGVDVYFENVGGAVLDAVLPNLRMGARIPLCGLVSHYNALGEIGFRNLSALLDMCVTLTGFRMGFVPAPLRAEAREALLGWWQAGLLRAEETVAEGIEAAPAALCGLFGGSHTGKQVVRLE